MYIWNRFLFKNLREAWCNPWEYISANMMFTFFANHVAKQMLWDIWNCMHLYFSKLVNIFILLRLLKESFTCVVFQAKWFKPELRVATKETKTFCLIAFRIDWLYLVLNPDIRTWNIIMITQKYRLKMLHNTQLFLCSMTVCTFPGNAEMLLEIGRFFNQFVYLRYWQ